MGDRHDYVALDWVKGEISETLNQARQALEDYAANPADSTRLGFCLSYIHQVHGTLQMVEFYGAALLAEEVEKLLRLTMAGQVARHDEALEVLMQAILQLPAYLERVQAVRHDLPMALLPILNDVRTARGEKMLSESALFSPGKQVISASPADNRDWQPDQQQSLQLRRLRQAMQMAQAGIVRNQDVASNAEQLVRVFDRLAGFLSHCWQAPVWRVLAGLAEGLQNGGIENGAAIRHLLRQGDRELRGLLEGQAQQDSGTTDELLRNLLFYIAKCPEGSPRIDALKQEYELQALWREDPQQVAASGPGRDVMDSVAEALTEELVLVKDQLDLYVRQDDRSAAPLAELMPQFKRIADTLAMLALGQPRRVMQQQAELLGRLIAGDVAINDAALMDLAGGLLFVEASVQGILGIEPQPSDQAASPAVPEDEPKAHMLAAEDLRAIRQQVINEARSALEQTREAINAYVINQWDKQCLTPACEWLDSVRGGLQMLPLERAADLIAGCRNYLQTELIEAGRVPDWVALDALADVVTSVDYYLERLADDDSERSDGILGMAEDALQGLRGSMSEAAGVTAGVPDSDRQTAVEPPAQPDGEAVQEQPVDTAADDFIFELPADIDDALQEPAEEAVEQPFLQVPEPEPPAPAPAPAEDELDAELLEIFVEEAGEVLETIDQYLPKWAADHEDQRSLTEVRRGFHTLKGSGRMVRALVIGELAWSVENMLNRVMDHSIQPSPELFALIDDVRALMPQLVEDFAASRQQAYPQVGQLSERAAQLARGEAVSLSAVDDEEPADLTQIEQAETPEPVDALPLLLDESFAEEPADTLEEIPEVSAPIVAIEAAETPDESLEIIDPLLLEIFANEAQGHLEQIDLFIDQCRQQGLPRTFSDALQRALHTLKGSAHMAGILPIAMLATPLEKMVKEFKANLVPAGEEQLAILQEASQLIAEGLQQLASAPQRDIAGSQAFLQRLEQSHQRMLSERESSRSDLAEGQGGADLLSIFLTDGIELLLDAADQLADHQAGNGQAPDSEALGQSLTNLADVAADVELPDIERLALGMEQVYRALADGSLALQSALVEALIQSHERLISMMDQVAAHQHVSSPDAELLVLQGLLSHSPVSDQPEFMPATLEQQAAAPTEGGQWSPEEADADAELVEIFLEEANEIIDSATASLQQWLAEPQNLQPVEALQRDLHTLKGGARMAEIRPIGDLSHELEFLYEGLCNQRYQPGADLFALLHACHDQLADMIEGVAAGRHISDGRQLIACIEQWRRNPDAPLLLPGNQPAVVVAPQEEVPATTPAEMPMEFSADGVSGAMLAMFLEEADELLRPCLGLLESDDPASAADLQHRLQSFVGSARLAGQASLAEGAETLATRLHRQEHAHATDVLRQLLGELDALSQMPPAAEPEVAAEEPSVPQPQPQPQPQQDQPLTAPASTSEMPQGPSLQAVRDMLRKAMEAGSEENAQPARAAVQESVKVAAPLLEELVNLAGETSIFRGRVEQQVSDFGQLLGDMEATIERVRDQLRRLDMETQAQIISRHQDELATGYEDFDPLEMDQYSQLQQLSRSLFESASDLMDLKETLASRSRDAETLLLQQARVNTELQEGLMRTRMVPFERLMPRLRRVVRQVAAELGKQVELEVLNAEGEMDRSVLERMIGPLEHMLRNAVDHGIEKPEQRRAAGKPEQGRIRLDLQRQGGEILLTLTDDGAGIQLEAVRRKAIERGLMAVDAQLSDQEVSQFILEAGFSTAAQVTQISGRGVGMDVVNAEVRQLGGSMSLDSHPGQGSQFNIRLPFTVSVNRALMVYSGDDLYAIPLNSIEGIVRVSGYELEAYYSGDAPPFEYAGKQYELNYLGHLLGTGQQPRLHGQPLPLPVILVRSAEHSVAVQVDALAGSREIVVKTLGRQFAVVPGLSGATILGDGRVVVILDLLAVIRAQQALHLQQIPAANELPVVEQRALRVMVVDDSITVRKVTSRLLERHGMEVVTAKDGLDAIAHLQEAQPDIMLLDIEMPRMDGFEVATLIRHDEQMKDLPIIMITSRTGEKHRERALAIGVDHYLGKPYHEAELLALIERLAGRRD